MRTSARWSSVLAIVSMIGVACGSGGPDPGPGASSGTPSGGPSGVASGSGGASGATEPGEALDVASITRIVAAQGYCGGRSGTCNGEHAHEIDFDASTLRRTGCPSADAGAVTRTLSADETRRVREALAKIRVSSDRHMFFDGRMFALTTTTASGETKDYSPEAACSHERFGKIVAGWEDLWNTVSAL